MGHAREDKLAGDLGALSDQELSLSLQQSLSLNSTDSAMVVLLGWEGS